MARIYVTPELGESVRAIRQQNKITGKRLAEHLGKSSTFITRLENADLLTIDEDDLWSIFKFISNGDLSQNDTIEKIYETLKIKFSSEDIENQVWFENFDTVVRQIPIPNGLIDEINERMQKASIEPSYLLSRINSNESLSDDEINSNYPYNTWWSNDNKPRNAKSIKIKLQESVFYSILSRKIDTTSYIFLLAITFYLIKCEKFSSTIIIPDEDNDELMKDAKNMLNSHKFYSLSSREQVLSCAKTKEEYDNLLSSFDREYISIVNSILSGFKYCSDRNIKLANNSLRQFEKNLRWDMGFMMKLISFDYSSITNASYSSKSELLNNISQLITKLSELPDDQKIMETY